MFRRLLVVMLAALVLAPAALATNVYVRTQGGVTPYQIQQALPGFQKGANDVRRWWGGPPVTLIYGKAPRGDWQITVRPFASLFVGGFHSLDPWGTPYAIIYLSDEWEVVLSHELDEMIADPYLLRTAQADRLYLVEICDPVEQLSYRRLGVSLSDFVGPDWYRTSGGAYFDYMHRVKRVHQILPGGYVSYWDGTDWTQEFG